MNTANISATPELTPHFSWPETIITSLPFVNEPDETEQQAIRFTAAKMEQVRQLLGNRPIRVNSWFRSKQVNSAVGGASNSAHTRGEAVDFVCASFGTPKEICHYLSLYIGTLNFDQLILEPSWVHISFINGHNRNQVLSYTGPGKYVSGLI